ncbi:MAG: hypothetical protein MHPSP_004721, partial [Paramarteilia canceri]
CEILNSPGISQPDVKKAKFDSGNKSIANKTTQQKSPFQKKTQSNISSFFTKK